MHIISRILNRPSKSIPTLCQITSSVTSIAVHHLHNTLTTPIVFPLWPAYLSPTKESVHSTFLCIPHNQPLLMPKPLLSPWPYEERGWGGGGGGGGLGVHPRCCPNIHFRGGGGNVHDMYSGKATWFPRKRYKIVLQETSAPPPPRTKIRHCGMWSIPHAWFKNYLFDRKQYVEFHSNISQIVHL